MIVEMEPTLESLQKVNQEITAVSQEMASIDAQVRRLTADREALLKTHTDLCQQLNWLTARGAN